MYICYTMNKNMMRENNAQKIGRGVNERSYIRKADFESNMERYAAQEEARKRRRER